MALIVTKSLAAELTGLVKDYATGKGLANVELRIETLGRQTLSTGNGSYRLSDLPVGRYAVQAVKEGYHAYTFEHIVGEANATYRRDIELKPSKAGEISAEHLEAEPRYLLEEVTVLTTRATNKHPVTFSNITEKEVQERSYGQDLPLLFTELPNVVAYSDGANGIGYSYLRMRGFGQNRVAVQVNGTPLNDAGTGEVFWIDLPDFAEDVEDIQVQRGVGSSLYGAAAFGGSINIVTRTPGLSDRPRFRAEGTYGTWNTRRAMVAFESGRIQDRYGLAGRLTRMETDGYRFGSWVNMWSYYLSAARFSPRHTSRLVFYGGPEKTHLAYEGVPRDYLEGKITGDKEYDRRFNPLAYPGEIDNFFQPHYELHDEWKLSDKLTLDNSLYVFRGDGYYDQWRPRKSLSEYFFSPGQQGVTVISDTLYPADYYQDDNEDGMPDPDTLANGSVVYRIQRFDVLRRRNVGETDGGWIPRLTVDHRFGESILGGEVRLHEARHEGWVKFGNPLPAGVGPDQRYYDYRIRKESTAFYVHNLLNLAPHWRGLIDAQFRMVRYRMDRDALWNVRWDKTWTFFAPRLGLIYDLLTPKQDSKRPSAVLYVNVSDADREPAYKDRYDPQDYWSLPINAPNRFRATGSGYEYTGPSLVPEKLLNLEAGTNWQWPRARLGINYYHMIVTDELVPYGTLDDLGVPVTGNAERTLHQGVEIVAGYSPLEKLRLSGNISFTDHRFLRYEEWDWNTSAIVKRDGNRLAYDPPYLANLRGEYFWRGWRGSISWQGVGKQFIDNTASHASAVPAYSLINLDLGYRLNLLYGQVNALELRLRVNNLLNTEYESFGFISDPGPVYIVGAPRAIYITTGLEF